MVWRDQVISPVLVLRSNVDDQLVSILSTRVRQYLPNGQILCRSVVLSDESGCRVVPQAPVFWRVVRLGDTLPLV